MSLVVEALRLRDDEGLNNVEIGKRLGVSEAAVRRWFNGATPKVETLEAIRAQRPLIRPKLSEVIDLNPQPFQVPVPRVARSNHDKATRCWTALVLTDTHVPYQDEAALSVIYGLIRDVQPRVIVHLGDLLDCYKISRFTKSRDHILSTQDEIDGARRILHHISTLAPEADKYYLEGNHENRLDEVLNTLPGTAAELNQLRDFRAAMTWPRLMRLDEIGWTFVPVAGQAHVSILPKLITKHGNVVRKWSGQSGKGEWEKYGKSGLSGHVHRVGQFYTQDFNGNHCWTECGCTCLLKPEYMEDPNWAHACVLVHFTPDGSRFAVEPVYIHQGRALFKTTEYRAA